jgi:excisionase family DNA binding protein
MPSRTIPSTGAVKEPVCLHAARQSKQAANANGSSLMLAANPIATDLHSVAVLTKRQAADYLQVTTRYLERMATSGRLRAYRPTGKLWRVRRSDLDAFLASGSTIGGGPQ